MSHQNFRKQEKDELYFLKRNTSCSWLLAVHGPEKKKPLGEEVAGEELGERVAAERGDGEDAEGHPVPDADHLR